MVGGLLVGISARIGDVGGHEEFYGPESDLLRYYSLASNCRLDKQKQV